MRIISKYKDYYDFLAGIYGIDDKLILDRTEFYPTSQFISENSKIQFIICGYIIEGLFRDGKFYYGSQLKQFEDSKKIDWKWSYWNKNEKLYYSIKIKRAGKDEYITVLKEPTIDKNNINEKVNCPIIIHDVFGKHSYKDYKFSKFPILKDYNLSNFLSPERIWLMLYDFLSKTKEIPNYQTDKEKIISKGFDYKHSFRNTK